MPQGKPDRAHREGASGQAVENDRARPWTGDRRGFLQAQKSEAQTYTSSRANQACRIAMVIGYLHRCNCDADNHDRRSEVRRCLLGGLIFYSMGLIGAPITPTIERS
jgi:hypothetical protein